MGNALVQERLSESKKMLIRDLRENHLPSETSEVSPVLYNLLSAGCRDYFLYVKWLGLLTEPDLMVLSSIHHYYYDLVDLNGIRILINIRRLDQIKHVTSYLCTIHRLLPQKALLVGCFQSSKKNNDWRSFKGSAKFQNGLVNIADSGAGSSMPVKNMTGLLEGNGFRVLDITRINGLMYFCAHNTRTTDL